MNPNGGIIDDLIVYKTEISEYMLVVNAANISKDYDWIKKNIDGNLYNERVSKCHKILEEVSGKYNLAATLIANKRDIDAYARNKDYVKFLHGWRFKIFGTRYFISRCN